MSLCFENSLAIGYTQINANDFVGRCQIAAARRLRTNMNNLIVDTARSVAFLSRIPVADRYFAGHEDQPMAHCVRAYGFAGAIIALPSALLLFCLLMLGLDALLAAALAVVLQLLLTGALHEDGLADCADGFGGGRDRQRVLDIMKDSTIGAYGGIALIMALLLRVLALGTIAASTHAVVVALALLSAAILSRGVMVWHWTSLPAAKSGGVAAAAGQPAREAMVFAVGASLVLAIVLALPVAGWAGIVSLLILTAGAGILWTRRCRARIEGHTGDTIGACQQVCEIAALLGLAVWC
tara:strand:+ start:3811 stop:4698 length:888 start_codon:yes stop_codon:yes gene_type:complete